MGRRDLRHEAGFYSSSAEATRYLAVADAERAVRETDEWGTALAASKSLVSARSTVTWAVRAVEVVLDALELEPDAVPDVVDDALSATLSAAEAARAAAEAWGAAAGAFQRAGDSMRAGASREAARLAREAARLALEAREHLWGVLGASGPEAGEAARRARDTITAAYSAIKEALSIDLRPFDKSAARSG